MTVRKTQGLVAAPFTPMRADGTLHLELIDAYARRLHTDGVVGAFICGTTGEGMSLSVNERRQVAERWVAAAPSGLRVMVHVGHNSPGDSQALAAHAASIGADSFATLAPSFFRSSAVDALVDWCAHVAAAAPALPFYYYHMPSMTGVTVRVIDFLRRAAPRIPNLAGVKYTFEDLDDFHRCLTFEDGRFDVLFGRDELLLSALRLGARGAVGSTYNFMPGLYRRLIACFERGDEAAARELQERAVRIIEACATTGAHPIVVFKSLMRRHGIDCGPPRLPLAAATPAQVTALAAKLAAADAAEWLPPETAPAF